MNRSTVVRSASACELAHRTTESGTERASALAFGHARKPAAESALGSAPEAAPEAAPGSAPEIAPEPARGSAPAISPGSAPEVAAHTQVLAADQALAGAESLIADCATWTRADRDGLLTAIAAVQRRLVVLQCVVVTGHRTAEAWKETGDRSLGDFLGRTSREGTRAGRETEARAKALADLPEVSKGFKDGKITDTHLAAISRAYEKADDQVAGAMRTSEAQTQLLDRAKRTDGTEFGRAVKQWAATHDPAGLQRDHDAQMRRRHFSVVATNQGARISGLVTTTDGELLKRALEARSPRPGSDDTRTFAQRSADALIELARHTLADTETTPGALVTPHVSLVISEDTWTSLRAVTQDPSSFGLASSRENSDSDRAGDGGARAGTGGQVETDAEFSLVPGGATQIARALRGLAPVCDDTGVPLPPSKIGQTLCDCEITRIVMSAENEPVNLGRTRRLYSREQRRAILLRDKHCVWQGCNMPARWCEVHHIEWWTRDNGETSVDNSATLCSFHHHLTHSLDLRITRQSIATNEGATDSRRRDGDRSSGPSRASGTSVPSRTSGSSGRSITYRFTDPGGRVRSMRTIC